jgi:hypothetical protein
MVQTSDPPICCDCEARRSGLPGFEDHHPLGKVNDPWTIPLRLSTHRFFTDRQYDWPAGVLDNPTGSEPVRGAALRVALTDLTAYFAARMDYRRAA